MQRDYKVYLDDILEAVTRINSYIKDLSQSEFLGDSKTLDAVVRNLEVIGEAAKKVPEEIRIKHPFVEWKKIAGLRDILIHEYFGIDAEMIWDIIKNKLPSFFLQIQQILSS